MRKGQSEILGFVFVVVLVLVIGMFFIFLRLDVGRDVGRESLKANSLLNSILYYTSDCGKNIGELLKDCAEEKIFCNPCETSRVEIGRILGSLRDDFRFEARLGREELVVLEKEDKGECPGERDVLAAKALRPTRRGNVEISLMVCL